MKLKLLKDWENKIVEFDWTLARDLSYNCTKYRNLWYTIIRIIWEQISRTKRKEE